MRGFCARCDKRIGGMFKPPAWHCPTCWKLYCESCAKLRVGLIFKRPVCPECKVEMKEK